MKLADKKLHDCTSEEIETLRPLFYAKGYDEAPTTTINLWNAWSMTYGEIVNELTTETPEL